MIDFIESQGNAFIAHRLRRSSERIVEQVGQVLASFEIDVPPRGGSMMLLIDEEGPIGVVDVARRLRLSHPLIVRMARKFVAKGLAEVQADPQDARRRLLAPTLKGKQQAGRMRALNVHLSAMFNSLFAEIGCSLPSVLTRLDGALEATPIAERLLRNAPPKMGLKK